MKMLDQALSCFQEALKIYSEKGVDQNSGEVALLRASTMHSLGEVYKARHEFDGAVIYF
jgi:hypothetical protein